MNKYVVRTSLFWLAAIALLATAYFYRGRMPKQRTVVSAEVQPAAVGPAASLKAAEPPNANASSEPTLAPVSSFVICVTLLPSMFIA